MGVRIRMGFSLVELLVTLGVILALISLILPSLQGARSAAMDARCLASMRSMFQAGAGYANDWKDSFPWLLRDGFINPQSGRQLDLQDPRAWNGFGWVSERWVYPLVLDGYYADSLDPALYCPRSFLRQRHVDGGFTRDTILPTGRAASMAAFIQPDALDPEAPRWDPAFFGARRWSDIWFASNKALCSEPSTGHDPTVRMSGDIIFSAPGWRRPVAAMDGAVSIRDPRRSPASVVFPEMEPREFFAVENVYIYTPHGERGRDW
jgi:type II secretory pathway pseudopilin PulG